MLPIKNNSKFSNIAERVEKLTADGYDSRQVSFILGLTRLQVKNIKANHKITDYSDGSITQKYPPMKLSREEDFRAERLKIYNKYKGKEMRWLSLGDLHFPFQSEKLIKQALKEDVNGVVLSEVFDFYSVSRFRKDRLIAVKDEIEMGIDFMALLKDKFKNVVWFEANHERRLWKLMQDRLQDKMELVDVYHLEPPIPKRLEELDIDNTCSWWVKLGNVVFVHPDWFSNVILRTAEGTQDYYLKADRKLSNDIDCIVQHHTHKQGVSFKYGQCLIESGCGCIRMDYLDEGRKRLESHLGYGIIHIDKSGHFDFNKSRLVNISI